MAVLESRWVCVEGFLLGAVVAAACSEPRSTGACGTGHQGCEGGLGGTPTSSGSGPGGGSGVAGASAAVSTVSAGPGSTSSGTSDGSAEASTTGAGAGGAGGGVGMETGGASGTAGAAGAPPLVPVDCSIEVSTSLSPVIGTVGIVEWSSDLEGIVSARIEFGSDTNYGMTAPVDLEEPGLRTLLLGMKADSEYHFQIVATSQDSECTSQDFTLTTGPLPLEDLPWFYVSLPRPEEVAQGFVVTSDLLSSGYAFVFNESGDLVWWYEAPVFQVARAKLSYDGRHMYIYRFGGGIVKVSMDGLEEESITLSGSHHDFTVTPDNGVVFLRSVQGTGCHEIAKLEPDGSISVIFDVLNAYPPDADLEPCWTNSLHYHEEDDSYTFSDLNQGNYVKITSDGEVVWRLGGRFSDFSGAGADFSGGQHGHHMLGPDRILIFNNRGGASSRVIEVELDLITMTASEGFNYSGGPGSSIFGDVQRLPNGNTLVTYSSNGVMHEVNAEGVLVKELSIPGQFGYANHRPTLYGPPPESR